MGEFYLTLPAHYFDDGEIVQKPNGEKEYRVKTSITIYNNDKKQVILAPENTVFLMNEIGNISAVNLDQKLKKRFMSLNELEDYVASIVEFVEMSNMK